MEHYLLFVEGAHDCAAVEKILKLFGFRPLNDKSALSDCFRSLVPSSYPFEQERLDRISPVPTFLAKDNKFIAIKVAEGDSKITTSFCSMLKNLRVQFLSAIRFAGIILDKDVADLMDRKKRIVDEINKQSGYQVDLNGSGCAEDHRFAFDMFACPDDCRSGNLEDVLIEGGTYPELLGLSRDYVGKVPAQYSLWSKSDRKKLIVGFVSNVLKPGKANQVSIADNDWFTAESLRNVPSHVALYSFLNRNINLDNVRA